MKNIKITIQYDGKNYAGWQSQKNANSIQVTLEKAIKNVTGEKVNLIGSGRTDAGVHSLGQVANFRTNSSIAINRYRNALNNNLPDDIRIIGAEEVDFEFHSRFDAISKRYKYVIYNRPVLNPINRDYSYHVIKKLNMEEIQASLGHFVGSHDFQSFMAAKSKIHTGVRTISNIEIRKKDELIEIIFEGKSFLRHMIRIIVGTLIYIGHGKIKKEDIPMIIKSKNRRIAGPTAPAQGLFLERVYYE